MGRRQNYIAYYTNGQQASGFGTKKEIEAIATLISHPGIGVGRQVCVHRKLASDRGRGTFASCWAKGNRCSRKATDACKRAHLTVIPGGRK